MQRRLRILFFSAFALQLLLPDAFSAIPPISYVTPFPFVAGERLSYQVTLDQMKIGKAIMKVIEKVQFEGKEVYHLSSEVKTSGFLSLFTRINDRVESYMDAEGLFSRRVEVRKERRMKTDEKVVTFDQIGHRAVQWKNNREEVFEIPPRVQDSLSSLYYFRTQRFPEIGGALFIDVHESGKNRKIEVRVLQQERVTTPAGTFDTIKVQTALPKEGAFSGNGDLFIWFTNDDRRMPVLLQSESQRGTVTVALEAQQRGEGSGSL
ncbi:MAG: DUF3108 domain-containing protein [Nitrospirae bacterium]|nr:DUF3108 domain-containing protein [Candidatus Manganitrophaceae bacterium]